MGKNLCSGVFSLANKVLFELVYEDALPQYGCRCVARWFLLQFTILPPSPMISSSWFVIEMKIMQILFVVICVKKEKKRR
jgi:hypothetical protein